MKACLLMMLSGAVVAADPVTPTTVPTIEDLHRARLAHAYYEELNKVQSATLFGGTGPIGLVDRSTVGGPVMGAISPPSRQVKQGETHPAKPVKPDPVLVIESAWGDDLGGIFPVVTYGDDTRELAKGNYIGPWQLDRIDPPTRCFYFTKTSYTPAKGKKRSAPFTEAQVRCANRATAIASHAGEDRAKASTP
ncbi:hypothetical protein [Chitinimonas sp. BJB300]|uniref:hypothetical protein n=1 Tax=Chitinimonas sp. BJB300 TaxID=1559339 RepID=UPI000C0CE170|nr:hypothetical protein [Chitinimonas sp. BJB300]PHV12039.1 hypothetical protein CSQ89_07815 [Chitinimonas sp. BJB300]TSJ84924.1 hypothetical protein FG002_018370 [Chitinimonas sp. BJB300]